MTAPLRPIVTPDVETADDGADPRLRGIAPPLEAAPFTGTERYRVCSCLGEGGFGVVYEVEDRELGRRLALKTLKPERSGFAASIRRLKREFRAAADLVHPNLVGLHELSSAGPRWFFTMDLVRGVDLLAHVRPAGLLSEARLREALRQLVAGVDALHRAGMVHRDLKPSNVLVDDDGRVVVLDFGLADSQASTDPELRRAGTPVYMSPEQVAGEALTAASDWYAVGVMLHQALTGALPPRPPDGGPAEDATRPLIHPSKRRAPALAALDGSPADLRALCERLLRSSPAARPDGRDVMAALGESIAASASRVGRGDAFVGRTRELAALESAYGAVQAGEPEVLRLHGQPGVGKSALLARFLDEVDEEGRAAVLTGRCHERESVPFKAFDGVVDSLVRYLRSLPRSEASALMPRDIHLAAQLFPVLEGVPAVNDVPRRPAPMADPREARRRAFGAIKELCARIADRQPLVIAIDDLHWGDLDSARLLAQLVAPPDRPTLLLVLSYRDEDPDGGSIVRRTLDLLELAGERGIDLPIEPLSAADAEELAAGLLDRAGRTDLDPRLIAHRAEGHPLFMAELARALVARDGRDGAPLTLIDILWQRVARLSEGARDLLETVAVAGRPLASRLCFEAAGLHRDGVDAVRVLRAEQLVRAGEGGEIDVFHDRIRDSILARADADRQRRRHLALAHSLERSAGADPEALARHFDGAGLPREAGHHALRAADAAMHALAFERAVALYQMALERGGAAGDGAAGLHEKLALALVNAGRSGPAGHAYLAAAALSGEGAHAIDLTRLAAEHLLALGDVEAGGRALDVALAAVDQVLPTSLAGASRELIVHAARVRLRGIRFRERSQGSLPRRDLLRLDVLDSAGKGLFVVDPLRAIAARARHYRMALDLGEPQRAALGMIGAIEGTVAFQRARPAIIDHLLDGAEAIGGRLGDPTVLGRALLARGRSHFLFGDWQRGAELCERAAALIAERCVGMAREQREAILLASSCRIRAGDLAAARRMGEALFLDTQERGDQVTEKQVCAAVMAPLRLLAGDGEGAAALLARVAHEDRCASVIIYLEATAATAAYLGRSQDAIETWRSRWARVEEMGVLAVGGFRVIVARSYASALLADPRGPKDVELAGRLVRSLRRLRFPHAVAAHALLSASLALRSGAAARAAVLLAEAGAGFDRAGMVLEAAACRHRRAQLLGEPGEPALAALRAGGVADPDRWGRTVVPELPG